MGITCIAGLHLLVQPLSHWSELVLGINAKRFIPGDSAPGLKLKWQHLAMAFFQILPGAITLYYKYFIPPAHGTQRR